MALDELPACLLGIKTDKKVNTVNAKEFKQSTKSKTVLVIPEVLSKLFLYAVSNSPKEMAALLIGNLQGEYLVISDIRNCKRSKSTATSVEIDAEEMSEISNSLDKDSFVVGWAHSHPRYGAFMSGYDLMVQKDFQNMFSDSVALVLDPFAWGNIEFSFFRLVDGKSKKMQYSFMVNENEALQTGFDK